MPGLLIKRWGCLKVPGWLSWASSFGSGHDLTVCGFQPRIGLCADVSEPGACFGFCVSLSFSLSLCPPQLALSLSQKQINIKKLKNFKKERESEDAGTTEDDWVKRQVSSREWDHKGNWVTGPNRVWRPSARMWHYSKWMKNQCSILKRSDFFLKKCV